MSAIGDERAVLAGKLAAAGVVAELDPRAVPRSCSSALPPATAGRGIGGWPVTFPVHVVAAPPGSADALDWMLDQVELILRTLGPTVWAPSRYGEADWPAYELTYTRDVTNPDC